MTDKRLKTCPFCGAADEREIQDALSFGVSVVTAPDFDAIENGGKRWHGEDHRVVSVRWEPYKPDGQRQMKAKGRWQEQVGSGDYWRWQNCERPQNLIQLRSRPSDQGERR